MYIGYPIAALFKESAFATSYDNTYASLRLLPATSNVSKEEVQARDRDVLGVLYVSSGIEHGARR